MSAKRCKERAEFLALLKAAFPHLNQGDKEALRQMAVPRANRGIVRSAS